MRYREHRYPCGQDVTIAMHGQRACGTIVNVSAHGARLAGVDGLKVGYRVHVDPGPGCTIREGEVRWARGDLAGLRFETPLDARTIATIRKATSGGAPNKGTWNLQLREMG